MTEPKAGMEMIEPVGRGAPVGASVLAFNRARVPSPIAYV